MDRDYKSILNDSRLLDIKEKYFDRLESLFKYGYSDNVFFLDGIYGTASGINPYEEPEKWIDEALKDLAKLAEKIDNPLVFKPLCIEFGPYGVHFIDKFFGAKVYYNEESKQWYNEYISTPIGSLRRPDIDNDETWKLAKRAADAFNAQEVSLPIFGLPTVASALNIAVNLYGEMILVAMYTEPESAIHDLQVINDFLCDIHRWYLSNIPLKQLQPVISGHRTQPYGHGQLCGCTTQLISGEMYRKFIAPFDDALLSVYPNGGMIHLCGRHTQHIPVWREMKSLQAVQLNDRAAEDLKDYFEGLREDQIIYLNPFEGMTVEQALDITGGRRIVIVSDGYTYKKIKKCCCTS